MNLIISNYKKKPLEALVVIQNLEKTLNRRGSNGSVSNSSPKNKNNEKSQYSQEASTFNFWMIYSNYLENINLWKIIKNIEK